MGQHTWFYKDKDKFLKVQHLFSKSDELEHTNPNESERLYQEADILNDENDAEYHDLFRTSKRNADNTYLDEVILSKQECDKFLKENKDTIYYLNKDGLDEFWKKYPNGAIDFG